MSQGHRHFCDAAGHYWVCGGLARRHHRGDTEPSVCFCLTHQVPMEDGDHSGCPVELLPCPDHFEQAIEQTMAAHERDGLRIPDYPDDDAIVAIQMLIAIKFLFDEGEPVGSALADAALDKATQMLRESGLLDSFITRAAMGMTF